MSILFVLIPLSVALMALSGWALFWAIDHGQLDDLDAAGRSIIDDEEP